MEVFIKVLVSNSVSFVVGFFYLRVFFFVNVIVDSIFVG